MSIDHLSGLPTELLVLTCGHVDKYELRHVRLSCKTLDSAAFDHWTDSFIKNGECRIGERNALARLNSTLAAPHLARKMERVSIVVQEHDFKQFQWYVNNQVTSAKPHLYRRGLKKMDIALVVRLLEDLEAALCKVSVKISPKGTYEEYSVFTHNFFCAILCSGVKVASYDLEKSPFDPELLTCPGTDNYAALSKHAVSIGYKTLFFEDIRPRAAIAKSQGVLELIRNARNLSILWLQLDDVPMEPPDDLIDRAAKISRAYFLAVPCPCLTELEITTTTCYTVDMVAFLGRVKNTLRKLTMACMTFVSDHRCFVAVLRQLQACSQLSRLQLSAASGLSTEAVASCAFPAIMIIEAGAAVITGSDISYHSCQRVTWKDKAAVQHMLKVNTSQWSSWCQVEIESEEYCVEGPCPVNHHLSVGTCRKAKNFREERGLS